MFLNRIFQTSILLSIVLCATIKANAESAEVLSQESFRLEKNNNYDMKHSDPIYYLPQSIGKTEVLYCDTPVNLSRWGSDINMGEAVAVAIDVVPAGSYQGRIVVARLHRMYGTTADTVRLYYSTDGGSSWNQWWTIYTLGDWQFWQKISLSCSRTGVAVFEQVWSTAIETDYVTCDIFNFDGSYIMLDVDSTELVGVPPMNPDCCCDAEDFSTDIWYYVAYMNPWTLEFRAFDENGGVHNSTTVCSEGWYPDIDWDFDNLFLTYWYHNNHHIYATFSPNYGSSWNGPFVISTDSYSLWPRIAGHGFSAVVVMEWPTDGVAYRYTTDFGNSWNPASGMHLPCDSTDVCPSVTEINSTNQYAFYYAKNGDKAYKAWMNPTSNQWYDHFQIGDVTEPVLDDYFAHDIRYLWNAGPAAIGAVWIDYRDIWPCAWFDCGTVGIEENMVTNPDVSLFSISPSFATDQITLHYELQKPTSITIEIFDITGRKIKTIEKGIQSTGVHSLTWNLKNDNHHKVSSGIYLVKFMSDDYSDTKQVIVVK